MPNQIDGIIKRLKEFVNSKFPILSIYLGVAQLKSPTSTLFVSQVHSQVHQSLGKKDQKIFKKDLERIESYIRDWDSRGKRSLVIFTAGKKLWEVLDFEFYLPPLCVVSYSPYMHPVTEALGEYKSYLVLLADREKARLFIVHLGEVEERKDVFDAQVPQRVKHGDDTWDQQGKIMRHIEDHLHRHLKFIAQETSKFVRDYPVSFVIVGGHKDIIPKIKKHLAYPLNKMVLGQFVTELNIPLNKVFLQSKKIAATIRQEYSQNIEKG